MGKLDAIKITQRLVKIGRYSGNEKDTADEVCSIMEELNFDKIERTKCGSVIGWVGPSDKSIEILFDGHIDIATVAGEWSFDPFCGDVKDGKILGRGTTDMKGGLAAALYAVSEYKKNNTLDKRIAVSATVMEETVEGLGLEEILDIYKPRNVVICEPSELMIMKGQKGRMEIMLTLFGKSAHASNPEVGINPMLVASKALDILNNLKPPTDDILGEGILVPTDMITEPYPSISAVPAKTHIRFDRRSLPGETEEGILNEISQALKINGIEDFEVKTVKNIFETYTGAKYERPVLLPPWIIDEDHILFKSMYNGYLKFSQGIEPEISAWKCCTNGSESAGNKNIPTIGLGPGSIKQAHTVDEFILVDQVEKACEIYIEFINYYLSNNN